MSKETAAPATPLAATAAVAGEPKVAAAALPVLLLEMQALEAAKGCCEVPSDAAAEPRASAAAAGAAAAESAAQ